MDRKKASDFDQELLDFYDDYAHSRIDRRQFIDGISTFAVGGLTVAALMGSLMPNYALASQVAENDAQITAMTVEYKSPKGYGKIKGYLAQPANASGKVPGVVVVHENRGLNPYIADVARRLATAGFMALAPDGLTPAGGYPGNDDEGRAMQSKLDSKKLLEDFIAAFEWLKANPGCTGKVGAVGFCFGGGIVNAMAVRLPDLAAAVPFYGRQPATADVPKIKAPLMLQYAGLDTRVNAGWPDYEAALKTNGKAFTAYIYPQVNHGFHNDTTPRYDEAAATLAWERTIAFFKEKLG